MMPNVCCNRLTQTLILECWLLIWGATTTHKSQIDFKCRNLKLINMEREMEQENLSLSLFRFSVVNNCVWCRIENRRYNKSLRISNIFLYCCVQDCINNINRHLTWTHILQSLFYRNRTNLRNSNKNLLQIKNHLHAIDRRKYIDDVDTIQRSLTSSSLADLIQILLKFNEICNCFGPPNLPGTAQCKRVSWQICANSAKKWFVYLYRTEHFGKVNAPDTGLESRLQTKQSYTCCS